MVIGGEGVSNKCEHDETYKEDHLKPKLSSKYAAQMLPPLGGKISKNHPLPTYVSLTAVIENFNDLILKYAPKRFSFQYASYHGRNHLATLDYSYHKDRANQTNKKRRNSMEEKTQQKLKTMDCLPEKESKNIYFMQWVNCQHSQCF